MWRVIISFKLFLKQTKTKAPKNTISAFELHSPETPTQVTETAQMAQGRTPQWKTIRRQTMCEQQKEALPCTFYIWKDNQQVSFHFHGQAGGQAIVILNTNNLQGREKSSELAMPFQKKCPGAASWALAGKTKGSNMHMRAQAPPPAPHMASFQTCMPNSPSHAHTQHPLSHSSTSPIDWNSLISEVPPLPWFCNARSPNSSFHSCATSSVSTCSVARVSVASMLNSQHYFTHIYPLKITVGLSRGDDSVIGVDNGDDVHPKQLMQCAVEIPALLLIVEIQVGHQNLKRLNRTCSREENDSFLGTALSFWNKTRL